MGNRVTTIILGGGQGKRLFPLTGYRSKPAVPIGSKYRLVDVPISNSLNSGLRRIYVLTQFNSVSLHRHIHRTYPYEPFNETSIELLAAEQTPASLDWFQGTADAVRKHLPHYHLEGSENVLILSGDHLYRMDYTEILKFHEDSKADVTISTVPVPKKEVSGFGIMQIGSDAKIKAFLEKPSSNDKIAPFIIPQNIRETFGVKGKKEQYLASMGVYVFKTQVLIDLLQGKETDFGKEIIPKAIERFNSYGYVFNDYWRDIGTIGAFFEASIDLTQKNPAFDFMSPKDRIFTRARFLPPTRTFSAQLDRVLVGEGSLIEGAHVEESVIGVRSIIRSGSVVRKSVLMGNDFYEQGNGGKKQALGIGQNCRIQNCIIDKNVRIGNNVSITNRKNVQEEDGKNYHIREGIVIIPKAAVIADGTRI